MSTVFKKGTTPLCFFFTAVFIPFPAIFIRSGIKRIHVTRNFGQFSDFVDYYSKSNLRMLYFIFPYLKFFLITYYNFVM